MTPLASFLAWYAARPMTWGVDDCSLMLADWWRANHGTDPAAHLRGAYHDELGKRRIVARAGGLVPLVSDIAERVGASPTDTPADGAMAVLAVPGHPDPVGGIRSGAFWAIRSADGVGFVREAEVLRAWAI